jgi:hypothetical protein
MRRKYWWGWLGYFHFQRDFVTFNEGGTPFNFTIDWQRSPTSWYVYLFGHRWHN